LIKPFLFEIEEKEDDEDEDLDDDMRKRRAKKRKNNINSHYYGINESVFRKKFVIALKREIGIDWNRCIDNIQSARLAGFGSSGQQSNYLFKKQNLQK
jgi:hypothetical protein